MAANRLQRWGVTLSFVELTNDICKITQMLQPIRHPVFCSWRENYFPVDLLKPNVRAQGLRQQCAQKEQ